MTRKDGYVFKVRVLDGRKKDCTGGVGFENIGISAGTTWEWSEETGSGGTIQKEIVRVYKKEEETADKKGEKEGETKEGGNSRGHSATHE
jgi:hypothetical protein